MRFVSHMVTTTYINDDAKIKLLKDTINYISNNTTDEFRQFKGVIDDVKNMLRFPFDRDKVIRLASEAIKLWNFARKSGLTNHVSLLRQIIDLFKNHPDCVWTKEEADGLYTPCKIYHTARDVYFRKHEHITTKPHEPFEPSPVEHSGDAGSKKSLTLDALLLRMKELSN
jgi:hypothetical protein